MLTRRGFIKTLIVGGIARTLPLKVKAEYSFMQVSVNDVKYYLPIYGT